MMQKDIFYALGKGIYKGRVFTIIGFLILIFACVPLTPKIMQPFKDIGFIDPASESAKTNDYISKTIGYSYNHFIIMYQSDTLQATSSSFMQQVKQSLANLKDFPADHEIIYPSADNQQISKDGKTAYAIILFKDKYKDKHGDELVREIKSYIKPPKSLTMKIGGEPVFLADTQVQTQVDLYQAEYFAAPVAIITMLIVFGTVVAASVPIVLGAVSAFLILMTLFGLGQIFSLSVFTLNIALLLGICLSLDYALLMVNRYRDELNAGNSIEESIAITLMTAGKAVFFSGLAVLISLSALLLFPINVLFSVGMGGLAAVFVSVLSALILLPASLALLGPRIHWLPVRAMRPKTKGKSRGLRLLARVTNNPLFFFVLVLFILLLLSYPFLKVQYGISNFRILPKTSESRQVFDIFEQKFGEAKLSPIVALVKTEDKDILSRKNIKNLYNLSNKLLEDPRIKEINGIVNTTPRLTRNQYQMLYDLPKDQYPAQLNQLLNTTTTQNATTLTILSKYPANSPQTIALVKYLRKLDPGNGLSLQLTGASVNTIDVLHTISKIFPYAFLWIVAFTYLVLLFLLRSVILPLKAILMTILSVCTSYGVLVLVVQEGHLHTLLNFEPQGMLDISLLIIIFCALFGISMDYEVFLLSRIKEYFEKTNNNSKSILFGIERSWKIISSAAIIVILICFCYLRADILIVKAFGLGIAIAVFVDAFIIRTIFVPATMALLNRWNWYLPRWLDAILPKISFDPEHVPLKKKTEANQ